VKKSGDSIIYDTSSFYSDTKKFTIKRSSDDVVSTFSPSDLISGVYATWLGVANGIIVQINSDGNLTNPLNDVGGVPKLLPSGFMDFNTDRLAATYDSSINPVAASTIFALVIRDMNNVNNQRYNFAVLGINNGYSINYRSGAKRFYVGHQFNGNSSQSQYIDAPSLIDSGHNNVVVGYFINNQPVFLVNNVLYSNRVLSDSGWTYIEDVYRSRIILGSRYTLASKIAKYTHCSAHFNPTRTPQEISNELIGIYQ